jgi:hypothetical protein
MRVRTDDADPSRSDRFMRAHVDVQPYHSGSPTERLRVISEDVRTRLGPICAQMPRPRFDEMVARIALVQLTFEQNVLLVGGKWT